jgi:uncharacterized protein YgfB (UPF0149 family)
MPYHEPWQTPAPGPHYANGTESMFLGSLLGQLTHGQSQTITVLQRQAETLDEIRQQLSDNARVMQERLPQPSAASKADALTWRDWAQIILAGLIVIGALLGRVPLKDVPGLIGKPFGF